MLQTQALTAADTAVFLWGPEGWPITKEIVKIDYSGSIQKERLEFKKNNLDEKIVQTLSGLLWGCS